jgi:hypothetical protein
MTATDKAIADHDRGAEPLPLQRRLTLTLSRTEAKAVLGVKPIPGEVTTESTPKEASPPR